MRALDIGKQRRARVWIGDLPDVACQPLRKVTYSTDAIGARTTGPRMAAIEVLVPLGPRSMYGLLGGEFIPNATKQLTVEVSVAAANERRFAQSLASNDDKVHVGLSAEYAKAVLAGVKLAKDKLDALAAGTLLFNRAAHGEVWSCDAVYTNLSAILVRLFNTSSFDYSDDELIKLFPATFG